jgi:predicted ATPase/class 3 adenylate cyclase
MARNDLPTGTVTFLFSDIEGSTRLLGQLGERYGEVLEDHHRLLREAFTRAGGVEVVTEGDAFFVAFPVATNAVTAAVDAQRALAEHDWPSDGPVRVRMGIHTGEGTIGADSYVGLDVHRAARISAAGHGGQILVSEATRVLAASGLSGSVSFRDLGEHRLRDIPDPEHLYQVVARGLHEEFPPPRTLDAKPGNLPEQLTSFVGRRREVEEVKDLLLRSRLLTLTGPGGTGKTRLSMRVAAELREEHRDGTYFVGLAPLFDGSLVAPTMARTMGLREEPGRRAVDTLIEHLRTADALLVLDNFEQVLGAAHEVAELLAETERLRLLVTSRERLNIVGEREYGVPPLALPDHRHLPALEALTQYEAVALFVERGRAVRPAFAVTNENAPAVAEICARLDGLPLAIELAAAWVKVLSPGAILGRLGHRLGLLSGGARDRPARQQTLRDAIAWSYDLLEYPDRQFFARLAVFVGGATLESIESVCSGGEGFDALDHVASLVNKSLLRQIEAAHGEPRFFMLETIREFALEQLVESDEHERICRRHAEHFLEIAEASAPDLFGPKQADLLDALEHEHDNFRAALTWAAGASEVRMSLRLGAALWRFWQMRGHLREGAERLAALVAIPRAEDEPDALALALEAAGGVSYWMGRWDEAKEYWARCLEIRRALGEPLAVAEALYNLSFAYTVPPPPWRDPERARELNEEAMALFREHGDHRGLAKTLWALSNVHQVTLRWAESRDASREALELFLELDDRFGAGWCYHGIGVAAAELGDFGEARRALSDGLNLFVRVGDVTGIAMLLGDFAMLEGQRGECERASRLHGASLTAEQLSGQGLVSNLADFFPGLLDSIRGGLSEEEHGRLVDEGRAMSTEEAVRYALGGSVVPS